MPSFRSTVLKSSRIASSAVLLAAALSLPGAHGAFAEPFSRRDVTKGPLVLAKQGSFFVGGDEVEQTATELGFSIGGHVVINQMYVRYMIPQTSFAGVPVVMIHGSTLSGKSFETTPDGRMGWAEYFVRRGHPVYNIDAIARARSGFDISAYNKVKAGELPPSALPDAFRVSAEFSWQSFRFGPTFGSAYADEKFPVAAVNEFLKQGIPDLNGVLPAPNPNYKALSDLAIKLKGAVLLGHSQGAPYTLEAALTNPAGIRGAIVIEPGGCGATTYTDAQIRKLARIPILVMFGDHLKTAVPGFPGYYWQDQFNDCKAFVARVNAANGKALLLWPPDLGIHGNSHLIMMDKNNLKIADLLLKWIDKYVRPRYNLDASARKVAQELGN